MDNPTFIQTVEDLKSSTLDHVSKDDWDEVWDERWVVFADLIGFASMCMYSDGVTVNNIVRFHRAVNRAASTIQGLAKFQFTDACYVVTDSAKDALKFASNVQNECLAFNRVRLDLSHSMFHQMIVPKVTICKGRVLRLPPAMQSDELTLPHLEGISKTSMLAGEGIVKAYNLESATTGALISATPSDASHLKRLHCDEVSTPGRAVYNMWRKDTEHTRFNHDGVVDIPWLVLAPAQRSKGVLLLDSWESVKVKLKSLLGIWRRSFSEHLYERTPTSTLKQYGGGITHLCDVVQVMQKVGKKRWDLSELKSAVESL